VVYFLSNDFENNLIINVYKHCLLDTSFLMEKVGKEERNIFLYNEEVDLYVHALVLKELEGLKKNDDEKVREKARTALKYLREVQQKIDKLHILYDKPAKEDLEKFDFLDSYTDKVLVWLGKKLTDKYGDDFALVTFDNAQLIAARNIGVNAVSKYDTEEKKNTVETEKISWVEYKIGGFILSGLALIILICAGKEFLPVVIILSVLALAFFGYGYGEERESSSYYPPKNNFNTGNNHSSVYDDDDYYCDDDDELTDPAYSSLAGNIYHDIYDD